jgi:hypothetical protein
LALTSSPFGIQYDFFLADAVHECPEWLVPMGSLAALAAEHGLRRVSAANFQRFFERHVGPHVGAHGATPHEWDCAAIYRTFAFRKLPEAHNQDDEDEEDDGDHHHQAPSPAPYHHPHDHHQQQQQQQQQEEEEEEEEVEEEGEESGEDSIRI